MRLALAHLHRSPRILGIQMLVALCLMGCAGSPDGEDDDITLCTTHEEMDHALARATDLWNDRQTIAPITPHKPPGMWLDFQSVVNHEVGHIVMKGRGDEHLQTDGAVMFHTICFRCYRHALTEDDEALLDREEKKGDVRTIIYLGVQDDTNLCDYEARWKENTGRLAEVRGNTLLFQRQYCQVPGRCFPWVFPAEG